VSDDRDCHAPRAHRVIILGASNARIGISVATEAARQIFGQPLDVMAAIGFGRSYGIRSWVLGRSLEGILECGLWSDLADRSPLPTTALVTDVGNDIVYDVSPKQTAEWIAECLHRLSACADRLILTTLPIESVQKLTRWRFVAMRTVLFPKCRLDLRTTVQRAVELNELLLGLAARFQIDIVHPCEEWFGFDPIHIHRRYRREAWKKYFCAQENSSGFASIRNSWAEWFHIHKLRPLRRSLFGWQQTTLQPAGRLRDRTTISLY
jgi:hypothetical protein